MANSDFGDDSFPRLPLPKAKRPVAPQASTPPLAISTATPSHGASQAPQTQPIAASTESSNSESIGPYVLIRRLGQGGMGVVYLAQNSRLNRPVAIKLLNEGNFANSELQQRFEFEARVAANLQHENIVRVFDFGNSQRGPFIAFEFIQGQTLADLIRGNPLPPTEAAKMLAQLARAVYYAHQHQVVHRDLKPANVLLDSDKQPKITDFGLARSTEHDTGMTRTGEVMGTPAYMSPEQATGAGNLIGPATDIYSIGAILFEALTGTPPFRGPDPVAVVVAVVSTDPPSLRQLDRTIPRDLETICLKCLEKLPSKRYSTALALAEDLDRYLHGLPILAKPASIFEKSWKLARRYPSAAALIVTAMLGMIAFISYGQWKNNQLSNALARSDSNFREALKAAQRRIESVGQPAEQTLEEELEFLQTIRNRPDAGIATRYEMPIAASIAGQILVKLGRTQEALNSLQEAETTLQRLVQDDPRWNDWYRSELASVFVTRAQAEQSQGRLEDAEASLLRGLGLFKQLAFKEPNNGDILREQAALLNNLGILASRSQRLTDAIDFHRQSLKIKQQLVDRNSGNTKLRSDLIVSLANLASNLLTLQELDEAAQLLDNAQQNLEQLPVAARASINTRLSEAGIHLSQARIMLTRKQPDAMKKYFATAIDVLRKLAADYPEIPAYQLSCADAEIEFGRTLMSSDEVPASADDLLTPEAKSILSQAVQQFQSAANRYARLTQINPDDPTYRRLFESIQPGIDELQAAIKE
ncbi:MAG: serine/threonine-protein kinase [Pirellulales bacterium]